MDVLAKSLRIVIRSMALPCAFVAVGVGVAQAQPTPTRPQTVDAGLGRGVTVRAADGDASLTIRARTQLRGTYLDFTADRQSQSEAIVRRMRVVFDGYVLGARLTYYVQLSFANLDMEPDLRVPLRDAYITWALTRDARLRAGQMKVPFGRQRVVSSSALQMVDRSVVVAELNLDRDVGVQLFSDDLFGRSERLGYALALFGGDGRNRTGRAAGLLYVARLEVRPLGAFDDEQEADLERTPSLRFRVGAGIAHNQNTNRPRSTTGVPYPDGDFDYTHMGVDLAAKRRGLSLSGELLYRGADRDRLEVTDADGVPLTIASRSGWGGYVQGGRMIGRRFEITGRYGRLLPRPATDPMLMVSSELGGGLSFYPRGQDLKLQADYFHLTADDRLDSRQVRIQLQLFF